MEGIYCKRTDNCEQLELVQNSWDDFYENEDTDVIPTRQSEMTSMKMRTRMLYHLVSLRWLLWKWGHRCYTTSSVWDDFYENEDTDVIPPRQSEMISMKIRTQMLYQLVSLRWFLWNWGHRCYTTSSVWDDFYENKDTDVIPARQSEMTSMKLRTQMLYHLVSLRWLLWNWGHRCYTSSSVWDDFYEIEDTDVIPSRQSEMTSMKLRTQMLYQLVSLRWLLWNWGHRCYTISSVWDDFYEIEDTDVIPARQSEMISMKLRTQMSYHLVSLRWLLWNWGHRCYTTSSVWDDFYEIEDTDVIPARQSEMTSMKLRTQMLYQLVSLRWLLWNWGHRCYTSSSVWDDFYEIEDTDVIPARQSEMTSMKLRTQMLYQLVSLRWLLWNWGHRCYTSSSVWDDFYEIEDTDVIPARQSEMISMKMRTQMLYQLVSLELGGRWL